MGKEEICVTWYSTPYVSCHLFIIPWLLLVHSVSLWSLIARKLPRELAWFNNGPMPDLNRVLIRPELSVESLDSNDIQSWGLLVLLWQEDLLCQTDSVSTRRIHLPRGGSPITNTSTEYICRIFGDPKRCVKATSSSSRWVPRYVNLATLQHGLQAHRFDLCSCLTLCSSRTAIIWHCH